MARNSTIVSDTVSSVADIVGLGDFLDFLTSGFSDKTGDDLALELLQEIQRNQANIDNLGNSKLNQLQSKLNELSTLYNKGAFKSLIGTIQNRVANNLNNVQSLQNDIQSRINQQQNIAQEAMGRSRTWAKSNESNLRKDIDDLNQQNEKSLNNIEQTVV